VRLRTFGYLTAEAVGSVRDNVLLSVAAVSTVAISLLVLATVALLALNLQHLAAVVDAQVQVVAYLQPTATSPPEPQIVQQIAALPHVSRVEFVSKDAALQHLKELFGKDAALIDEVEQQNPLPDSVNIYVDDPRAAADVFQAVQKIDGVQSAQNAQDVVDRLIAFTRALRVLGIFLVGALALATVVVIGNTIRVAVYARRDQISIMKLVGATDGFIRWPFFLEGAILGLAGAAVAGAVVWWGYRWVDSVAYANLPFLPLLRPEDLLPRLAEALLLGGVVLGALGSAVSVRKHLDV
jgi:cell division transport system permease protein